MNKDLLNLLIVSDDLNLLRGEETPEQYEKTKQKAFYELYETLRRTPQP